MLDNDIACRIYVSAGINAADNVNGAVNFQSACNGCYVFADNNHIGNDNPAVYKLKFSVHTGKIGHAVIGNRKTNAF